MALSPTQSGGRPMSLPNMLTYGRVIAVPVVVGLLAQGSDPTMRWIACGVFVVAGVTDFLDGYLARAWKQQSSLGRMLDPIADKLLVAATLMMLVYDHTIPGDWVFAAIVILCREILVSGLREFLAELHVSVPVSRIAKIKTTAQMIALGVLIVGPAGVRILPETVPIGLGLLLVAAVLTLYTGLDYMKAGAKHFIE